MDNKTKHTPTPWKQRPIKFDGHIAYVDIANDTHLAATAYGLTEEKALANAAFIVRACNSHAELAEALELAFGEITQLYCELRGATSWSTDNPGQRSDCMNKVLAALSLAKK